MRKKWLVSITLLLLLLVAACSNNDEDSNAASEQKSTGENETAQEDTAVNQQVEMPEPDLENIPDVVAEVNGEKILKDEFETTYTGQFQQALMQAQMFGQEVDQDQLKTQVADALIGQKLIIQETENRGMEASKEDIDNTLNSIAEQNGLKSQDELFAALEEQGRTKEEVLSLVETQVKIDKLIAEETGDVNPTDEELQELYDNYKAQIEQMNDQDSGSVDIPTFDEIKPDLVAQAKSQKENETYQTLIEKLKSEADITNNM